MSVLTKLFEHNNWANILVIEACYALTGEQLDAKPWTDSEWSVRQTLSHIVESQDRYLQLLTLPPEARSFDSLPFAELRESAIRTGDALLQLAHDENRDQLGKRLRTTDGYFVEPWLVMVQAINHGTEHRRQICGMLRKLGVAPPQVDGWAFGEEERAFGPVAV